MTGATMTTMPVVAWPGGSGMYRSPAWIRAMASRVGETEVLAADDGAGSKAAMLCFRNTDPEAYEAYNLGALVLRVPPVFDWSPEGSAELAAVRGPAREALLFPNHTAVLPGYQHSLVWSGPRGAALLPALLAGFTARAETEHAAAVALLYVTRGEEPVTSALAELGYHRFPLTSRAVLPLKAQGLEGYLDALPAHRRRRVRSEVRALRAAGMVSWRADPADVRDLILRLRLEHLEKLGQRADRAAEDARLAELLANFPAGDVASVVTESGGHAVGTALLIRADRILHCVLSATARDAPPLSYFETTFYAPISLVANGVSEIDYGIGHLKGKALRGCESRVLDGWARAFDPAADRLVAAAAGLADRHNLEAAPAPVRQP
jgi:hypothetical protein